MAVLEGLGLVSIALPRRAEIWLAGSLRSLVRARRESRERRGVVDILFAVADHFEPLHGGVSVDEGLRRVETWLEHYPRLASSFVDADGRRPQHTFFFPIEQYRPELIGSLASLCGQGFGEVEIHLHHDRDTAVHLRRQLEVFANTLRDRHGLLPADESGRVRYGFIHGNWALSNSLPDGRWCGVDDELAVLMETGCYADFTLPAAPSPAQTRTVNQVYYAEGARPGPRAHETGVRAAVGRQPSADDFLLVQGPLRPSFRRARWAIVPRVENGALHAGDPPTLDRVADWLSCGISVAGRPEWVFVKVHTHGAPEPNARMLLGDDLSAFHRRLLASYNDGERYRLHYVTAREMVNIIHAAEDGMSGNPNQFRDYRLQRPPAARPVPRSSG
ncbi:MAG: hypothetical protein AB1806_16080 [Acidobacteriota bacterium]